MLLHAQIPNHYLRDFPIDVGNEPSEPIAAGMNRYAMSNVWNRLTNTPGTPSATTGPEHQNPARFNADGTTPHTNFLFAKVEQLVTLPVRSAVVRFFLKNPGSGGGAANLTLLGEVPVPAGIGVGMPQPVSLPWTVATGVPNHSCIFGVVRSDAEPEGDQSALDWWQFETLAYNDNDWAQRKLDIENVTSSNANDSNVYESAPFFIELPPARQRPSPFLTLEIDASRARPLKSLALEVVNGKTTAITPGQTQSVRINTRGLRERLVLVLHAEVPGKLKAGTRMAIGVNPSFGRRSFVGYGTEFRIAGRREVVDQMLDVAGAALGDLATLAGCARGSRNLLHARQRPLRPAVLGASSSWTASWTSARSRARPGRTRRARCHAGDRRGRCDDETPEGAQRVCRRRGSAATAAAGFERCAIA